TMRRQFAGKHALHPHRFAGVLWADARYMLVAPDCTFRQYSKAGYSRYRIDKPRCDPLAQEREFGIYAACVDGQHCERVSGAAIRRTGRKRTRPERLRYEAVALAWNRLNESRIGCGVAESLAKRVNDLV